MAKESTIHLQRHLTRDRYEDRLSTSSYQPFMKDSTLNYRNSNSVTSESYLPSSADDNDRVDLSNSRNHGNAKNIKNQLESIFASRSNSLRPPAHSVSSQSSLSSSFDDSTCGEDICKYNTFPKRTSYDSAFESDTDIPVKPSYKKTGPPAHSAYSQSSLYGTPPYGQTSPEYRSTYDKESVYEPNPYAQQKYGDSALVRNTDFPEPLGYPQAGSPVYSVKSQSSVSFDDSTYDEDIYIPNKFPKQRSCDSAFESDTDISIKTGPPARSIYSQSSLYGIPPYGQTSPEYRSTYDKESVYEPNPYAQRQYGDSALVRNTGFPGAPSYLQAGRSAHSVRSLSSVTKSFDESLPYGQISPEYRSTYDRESVYEPNPYAQRQYGDSALVRNTDFPEPLGYPQAGSIDNMDNPETQTDVYGSEDAYPSNGIYENVPHPEDVVYDEVDDLKKVAQPAVEELISTEESYVNSLRLLTVSIQPRLEEIPNIDVKGLFSNLNKILPIHESFLRELKDTEHDQRNQITFIGSLFQEFSRDMENAYSEYCYTYTRSTSLLHDYQKTHVAQLIQNAMKSALSGSSSQYTDLTFYLIMPVQRITKYPLLLQNILSTDTQNKESQDAMKRAKDTMEEVNAKINEYKRRREIADKYRHFEQRTIKEKFSTVNANTLFKKYQRFSMTLRQQAGIVPKREDKEFDIVADRFNKLAAGVIQMEENVISYVKNVEEYFSIQPETYPMEQLQGSVHPLNGYILELSNSHYPAFKRKLQLMVLLPLGNLSECLKGPKSLIRKRMDKLLDYENLEEKHSETGRMTYEEEDIVNNYKTIHSMLLSELPKCISLSYKLLHNIFLSFIVVQRDLAVQGCLAAEEHASQMECSVNTIPEHQFRRWVENGIQHSIQQLNEFTKKFDEELPVPIPQEHLPVIERKVQRLLTQYSPDKLYLVMSSVKGSREMELTLNRGDVVAVIQTADSKGNKSRWLVNNGESRGYVPNSKLQPYHGTQSPTQSPKHPYNSPQAMKTLETRRHSVTAPVCPYPPHLQPQDISTDFRTVAGYSFTARSQVEVSITEGEPVTVLEPHDKNGSPEWSLVEVSGHRGYVPSSYIIKVPAQGFYRRTSLGNYT